MSEWNNQLNQSQVMIAEYKFPTNCKYWNTPISEINFSRLFAWKTLFSCNEIFIDFFFFFKVSNEREEVQTDTSLKDRGLQSND